MTAGMRLLCSERRRALPADNTTPFVCVGELRAVLYIRFIFRAAA